MHRRITALLLILAVMHLSGCVSHIELDELAIVEAVGIDRAETGYTVTVQYFNTDSTGGVTAIDSTAPNAVTVSGHGVSVEDALRMISYDSGKKLMLGSAGLIVFGKDAAGSMREALTFAVSHYSGDQKALIAVCDGKAEDVMNVKFSEGNASSDKLESIIKNACALGIAAPVTLYEAMEKLCSPTESLILPLLKVTQDEAKFTEDSRNIIVSGSALCTSDTLADTLLQEGSSGTVFLSDLSGTTRMCRIPVSYHGSTIMSEIYSIKCRVTPSLDDGKLILVFDISASCEYISASLSDPLGSKKEVESLIEKEVSDRVSKALEKTLRAHGADPFGLEYRIRSFSPEIWNSVSPDYRSFLKNFVFVVKCSVSTERFSMTRSHARHAIRG